MEEIFKKDEKETIKITISDRILSWTLLRLIPKSVVPNYITIVRLIAIPFVLYYLSAGHYLFGLGVFLFAAITDALDGALARTRNQITGWGKTLDPLADKLLIGSVIVVIAGKYISLGLVVAIIVIELLLIAKVVYIKEIKGQPVQAVWSGKIKMILQTVAVSATLIFAVFGGIAWFLLAQGAFYLAILFGLISLFVYRSV